MPKKEKKRKARKLDALFIYLENCRLAAKLLLQLGDLGVGGLTEFGQAGLQSLDILHQLGGLPFFGPELRLQVRVRRHL